MFEAIRQIIAFSGQEKGKIYRAIVISFFKSLLSMLRIAAIYYVILAFEAGDNSLKPATTALILLGVSILGSVILKSAADLQSVHAGYFMTAYKRLEIAERLKKVPMGYFNDTNLGEVTGIATTVLDVVENQGANVLVNIMSGLMNALVFLLCMPFFDLRFALIVLVGMVIYLLFITSMEKKTRKLSPIRQKNQAALVSKVLESLRVFFSMDVMKRR